jgi:hypothetical protein
LDLTRPEMLAQFPIDSTRYPALRRGPSTFEAARNAITDRARSSSAGGRRNNVRWSRGWTIRRFEPGSAVEFERHGVLGPGFEVVEGQIVRTQRGAVDDHQADLTATEQLDIRTCGEITETDDHIVAVELAVLVKSNKGDVDGLAGGGRALRLRVEQNLPASGCGVLFLEEAERLVERDRLTIEDEFTTTATTGVSGVGACVSSIITARVGVGVIVSSIITACVCVGAIVTARVCVSLAAGGSRRLVCAAVVVAAARRE